MFCEYLYTNLILLVKLYEIIIIVRILIPWAILKLFNCEFCKPRGSRHTYYNIVVIIVAGMKMHTRKEVHRRITKKNPSEDHIP